jgi:hypothetical protein
MPNWYQKIAEGLQPEEYSRARDYFQVDCWKRFYWTPKTQNILDIEDRSVFLLGAASVACRLAITAFLDNDREEGYRRLGNYTFLSRLNGPRASREDAELLTQYSGVLIGKDDFLSAFACRGAATDTQAVLQFFETVGTRFFESATESQAVEDNRSQLGNEEQEVERLFKAWRIQVFENGSFFQQHSLLNDIERQWCRIWHRWSKEYYHQTEDDLEFEDEETGDDPRFGENYEFEYEVAFNSAANSSFLAGHDLIGLYYLGSLETSLLTFGQIFAGSLDEADLEQPIEGGYFSENELGSIETRAKAREIYVSILNRCAQNSNYTDLLNDTQEIGTLNRVREFMHYLPTYYEAPFFQLGLAEWHNKHGLEIPFSTYALNASFLNFDPSFWQYGDPDPRAFELALLNYTGDYSNWADDVWRSLLGFAGQNSFYEEVEDWYPLALEKTFPETLAAWPTCDDFGVDPWVTGTAERIEAEIAIRNGNWQSAFHNAVIGSCASGIHEERLNCIFLLARVLLVERRYAEARKLLKICLGENLKLWDNVAEDAKNLNCLLESDVSLDEMHNIAASRFAVFHSAVAGGQVDIVEAMIVNGADVNSEALFECNDKLMRLRPLHLGAINGDVAIVELLLKHRANASTQTKRCYMLWNALHFAAANGHKEVAKILIKCSPDASRNKDADGNEPIHLAIKNRDKEMMSVLLVMR